MRAAKRNWRFDADRGGIGLEGAHGSSLALKSKSQRVAMVGGAGTVTLTDFIPDGIIIVACLGKVTQALSGSGLTTWSVGREADTNLFGATLALTAGTTFGPTDSTAALPETQTAERDLVFTAAAGVFSAGEVVITMFYYEGVGPQE